MVVPVPPTIPDSTLSPAQVRQKFSSRSLAGLGDSCSDAGGTCTSYDEMGECFLCDYSSITTIALPGQVTTPPFSSQVSVVNSTMESDGAIVIEFSDGTFRTIAPSGAISSGSGTRGYGNTGGTVTPAQASAWPQLLQSLLAAGVRIGTVANLPAGASLTANGTIVGSGQSLITAGGTGINATLSSILQNPMLLIGGFGILALIVLSGGRR